MSKAPVDVTRAIYHLLTPLYVVNDHPIIYFPSVCCTIIYTLLFVPAQVNVVSSDQSAFKRAIPPLFTPLYVANDHPTIYFPSACCITKYTELFAPTHVNVISRTFCDTNGVRTLIWIGRGSSKKALQKEIL